METFLILICGLGLFGGLFVGIWLLVVLALRAVAGMHRKLDVETGPLLRESSWGSGSVNGVPARNTLKVVEYEQGWIVRISPIFGDGKLWLSRDSAEIGEVNQGRLNGRRILGRKTIEMMSAGQMPPQLLPIEMAGDYWSTGVTLGLGLSVIIDLGQTHSVGSVGELSGGGAAGTNFWIDPVEETIGVIMTQLQPGGYFPLGPDFKVMAYQAME